MAEEKRTGLDAVTSTRNVKGRVVSFPRPAFVNLEELDFRLCIPAYTFGMRNLIHFVLSFRKNSGPLDKVLILVSGIPVSPGIAMLLVYPNTCV